MNRCCLIPALLLVSVFCTGSFAASDKEEDKNAGGKSSLTSDSRVNLIRGLQSEHAFTKLAFPMGKKGLTLKNGKITPEPMRLQQMVAKEGAAAKAGDRVQITSFAVQGNKMIFEINGGPRKGPKWYNRISVVGMGGEAPIRPTDPARANARGSILTLTFEDRIPDLTVDEVKQLLAPVFDFTPMSQVEAYQSTLPKIVQEAIKNRQVLVGMDRDMVIYSKGRPEKKYRDKDEKGIDYEEWIYGTPPAEVHFVRFIGNEVTRLEIMAVTGEKTIKTEREFELAVKKPDRPVQAEANRKRPTLLGPDEQAPEQRTPSTPGPSTRPQPRDVGSPTAPSQPTDVGEPR